MTGRQKIESLLADIANAGAKLDGKYNNLLEQHNKLTQSSVDGSKEASAVQAYLNETRSQVESVLASYEVHLASAKVARALTLQKYAKEMQANAEFIEFLLEAEEKTAAEIEATATYQSLLNSKQEVQQNYDSYADIEELEKITSDLTVINNVGDQFVRLESAQGVSEESRVNLGLENVEEDFQYALAVLFDRAQQRFNENNPQGMKVGAALLVLGLVVAAVACPFAAPVLIGGLIVGGALTAGGLFTMFYKAYQEAKDPMRQIGVAMEEKEKEARAALN